MIRALSIALLCAAPASGAQEGDAHLSASPSHGVEFLDLSPSPFVVEALRFPIPNEDLVIAPASDGASPTLLDVVTEYLQLTGQFSGFGDARVYLETATVNVDELVRVPPEEVQCYFESLLRSARLNMSVIRAAPPRVLRFESLDAIRDKPPRHAAPLWISSCDVERARAHPAMFFWTWVELHHADVHQVRSALRTQLRLNLPAALVPYPNYVEFGAHGADLARFVDLLHEIDEFEARNIGAQRAVAHEIVRLEHADSATVASVVEESLHVAASIRAPNPFSRTGGANTSAPFARIQPLSGLGALLVTCEETLRPRALDLIQKLDVPE